MTVDLLVFSSVTTQTEDKLEGNSPSTKGILLIDKPMYIPIIDEIILLAQEFADN